MSNKTLYVFAIIVAGCMILLGIAISGIVLSGALAPDEMESWLHRLMGILAICGLLMAYSSRSVNSAKPGDVIISAKSILINGKYHILNDENKTW